MKKILLIVDYEGKFRGGLPTTSSLDIDKMIEYFSNQNFEVDIKSFNEVANLSSKLLYDYVLYTSVENNSYKAYLDDILYTLHRSGCILIPRYEMLKAHDNKGYQEMLKKECGINSNPGKIYAKLDEVLRDLNTFQYPLIMKCVSGSVGKSVYKIDNEQNLLDIYDKLIFNHKSRYFNTKRKIKNKLKFKYDKVWYDRENQDSYIVIQDFIKELDGDWKILIFGNKFYTLKRGIKTGDFRASGSGILDFNAEPPKQLLDFANEVYQKLDVPFISLDIAMNKTKKCFLIEFQALHFGPLTLTNSTKYYTKEDGKWIKNVETSELERAYVEAYIEYIKNK